MKIMGIVNITPDSFFDGGRHFSQLESIRHAHLLIEQGASILDIGGVSMRPGCIPDTSEEEELRRVIPTIEALAGQIPLSIDTTNPNVARRALAAGASLINDVSGFRDPEMIAVAADSDADLCVMHMLGTPKTMQENPFYPNGVVQDIMTFFKERIEALESAGIHRDRIILDPGIGFGKTIDDNLLLIHNIHQFKAMGFRVLIGASRKTFIGKILNQIPEERLSGTLAIHTLALEKGADLIRVHDVKEHSEIIKIMKEYKTVGVTCNESV